jgi:hypothetical protein
MSMYNRNWTKIGSANHSQLDYKKVIVSGGKEKRLSLLLLDR